MFATTLVPPAQDDPPPRSGELFRQEALTEYVRGFVATGELELSPFWLGRAFWLLLGLLALAAGGAALYRFEEEVPGVVLSSRADRPELQLLIPARVRSLLAPSREIVATPSDRLVVRQVGERTLDAAEVRRMLGLPAGAPLAVEAPAILVTAVCAEGAGACDTSPAPGSRRTIRLGSESLASVVLPALQRRGGR